MMPMYRDGIRFCSRFGLRYLGGYVNPLREVMMKANLSILYENYIGQMILYSVFGFFFSFSLVFVFFTAFGFPLHFSFLGGTILGVVSFLSIMTIYHYYPYHVLSSKRSSIESNLPFAINHMSAIIASGVPPPVIFKLLSFIPEYGEIRNEAGRIVRNVEGFGMDITKSMKNVADRTPSEEFRQTLYGIVSTIETGGDLKTYMDNLSKQALFDYRIKREKYLQQLSTYADVYTAVLIAAPLFFVSILSIMSLVGGQIFGLSIPVAIQIGAYAVIPTMNILFLAFIHYTQPLA